jgi:hypothetical protein
MWQQVGQALDESTARVLNQFAGILPGLVAFAVAVLVSVAIAWFLSFVLRRFFQAIHLDDRVREWGGTALAEWPPAKHPSVLVARVVFSAVIVVGFVIGLAAFDASLTSRLMYQLFEYVPNLIVGVLLLLIGNLIARFLARSVLIGAVNMNLRYARLLSTGVKWMILVLAVAMALDHVAIGVGIVHLAFGILFGGIVLALALAVGLGSKELVSRSLERESARQETELAEPFHHL